MEKSKDNVLFRNIKKEPFDNIVQDKKHDGYIIILLTDINKRKENHQIMLGYNKVVKVTLVDNSSL